MKKRKHNPHIVKYRMINIMDVETIRDTDFFTWSPGIDSLETFVAAVEG